MFGGSSGPGLLRGNCFISLIGSPPSGSVIPSEVRSRLVDVDLEASLLRSSARCLNSCTTARLNTKRHTRTASPRALLTSVSQIVSELKNPGKRSSAIKQICRRSVIAACRCSIANAQGECQAHDSGQEFKYLIIVNLRGWFARICEMMGEQCRNRLQRCRPLRHLVLARQPGR